MTFVSWDFQMGVPKFLKLGLMWLWGPITLCEDFRLRWDLKQSFSLCWELCNDMLHATLMQGNQGDSWLLVVGSQIANLTPGPSSGHNICFKCPNGSCKPILDICVLRVFQWCKEHFNPMIFNPCNYVLKIQKSTMNPIPKVNHLGVWGYILSHFPILPGAWNVTPKLHSWPAPLQTFALVTSPRLGLQQSVPQLLPLLPLLDLHLNLSRNVGVCQISHETFFTFQ
jgi:hypothetical protein